jgi:hypothetical protein
MKNPKKRGLGLPMYGLLLLLLCLGATSEVKATHMAGGEISYKCIGPRRWQVTLTVYRYCSESAAEFCFSFNCPQSMTATPSPTIAAGGYNPNGCTANPASVSFTLQLVKVEDAEKNRLLSCGTATKNKCTNLGAVSAGNYVPGFEKYIFEGELNLNLPSLNGPNVCPYWDISWNYCCRNSMENINGQPSFHIQSTINIFDENSTCRNNSPVLKEEAIISFCAGMEYIYNMGAIDPDGDSLSYRIVKALQSPNSPVVYNPPYSEIVPFPLSDSLPPHDSLPGPAFVLIDGATGDISFNARNTTPGFISGNLCVQVLQWGRKPDGLVYLKGTTTRDLQILSKPCPANNPPRFITNPAAPGGGPQYNWEVCAGGQVCFTILARDTDFSTDNPPLFDSTHIFWNKDIVRPANKMWFKPDYTTPKPREDRWQFCWQTEKEDGRSMPYFFTVRAEDNRCPEVGKVVRNFSVKVIPEPEVEYTTAYEGCGRYVATLRKTNPTQLFSRVTTEIGKVPGDFTFSNGAHTVVVNNPSPATIPGILTRNAPTIIQKGNYMIRHTILTGSCSKVFYDTLQVDTIYNTPVVILPDTVIKCWNQDSVLLFANGTGGKKPYHYSWYRDALSGPVLNPGQPLTTLLLAGDTQTTTYYVQLTDSANCTALDSILLLHIPQIDITGVQQAIKDSSYVYQVTQPLPGISYQWFTSASGTVVQGNGTPAATIKWNAAGAGYVKAVFFTAGCTDTVELPVQVSPPVGIKETAGLSDLGVKPNPNNGRFNIQLAAERSQRVRVSLYNILGGRIYDEEVITVTGHNDIPVHTDMPDGVYLLTVSGTEGQLVKRVVISR